ncbi:TPA: hypothetical protein ACKA0T_004868 [Salmonella enterica subsp. enterica serovar Cotham]
MMSETVLIYCRLWPVTTALSCLLSQAYHGDILPLYSQAQLARALRDNPSSPVIMGFSPHEHVAELYHLQLLLSGRAVMFVASHFYWTDRRLPALCGLTPCQFSTLDSLCDPFFLQNKLRNFIRLSIAEKQVKVDVDVDDSVCNVTGEALIRLVNTWLYRQMLEAGLSRYEIMALLLLSESHRGKLTSRALSYYKNRGLYKLGMTSSIISLYRGIKVRPELQAVLP